MVNAFEAIYPGIHVTFTRYVGSALYTTITSQVAAGQPTADLVLSSQSVTLELSDQGYFTPYLSSQLSAYPCSYYDPSGLWAAAMLLPLVFDYNTNDLTKAQLPTTIWDFTNPSWKGQMEMWDPTAGSTGTVFLLAIQSILPDNWTTFVNLLATNVHPALNPDGTGPNEASGEYALGFGTYTYLILEDEAAGAPIGWFVPQGFPLYTQLDTISIMRTTTQLAAAELFENFVLSAQGQILLSNSTDYTPARNGLNSPYSLSVLAPGVPVDIVPTAAQINETAAAAENFTTIFG